MNSKEIHDPVKVNRHIEQYSEEFQSLINTIRGKLTKLESSYCGAYQMELASFLLHRPNGRL